MAPRCSPPPGSWPREIGALTAEWHGFNVLHTAAARVGALDLGFLPGPNGKALAQMLDGGVDVLWLLGADEFDTAPHRRRHLRHLPGPSRRSRRRARRRDPARRRLHRKARHLRQHRRPRAARLHGVIRPARRARTGRSSARSATCSAIRLPYDDDRGAARPAGAGQSGVRRVGFLPRFGSRPTAPAPRATPP